MPYNPQKIGKKWQKIWGKIGIFKALDKSKKPKFYCLDMFPYPSAEGLHVGHLRGYTFSDVISKKKMMEGYNVLHPMGWDAFGLPAENFAIKTGIHPVLTTKKAIKNIKKQLISTGFGYDWQREINSSQPEYYKWTQWMFLKLYKRDLAYKKEAPVNFCPSCKTVLAREQVIDGKCERCDSLVEKKYLKQWFFKITDYAERLLNDLEKIDWPEKIKVMQRNWIGKSEGTEIKFLISNSQFLIDIFTTRADTLFGCTYVVVAPEYPLIEELKPQISNWKEIEKYMEEAKKKTEIERLAEDYNPPTAQAKTGIELKGIKAVNPINNQEVPIFVADYVLMEYGTGAIMAVPAHDQRDLLFAKKYNLPIVEVIKSVDGKSSVETTAFEEDGILTNSGVFNGLDSTKAKEEITKYLEKRNLGKRAIHYKLRDWLISRQRYWGAPIPIIYCPKCGGIPVPEQNLPVLLLKIKDFKPTGKGESPLAKVEKFVKVKCPKCGKSARRETDTLDTFVCSSWYFLRYVDPKNQKEFASKGKIKNWLPVDLYIGGAEHAVMHLLYARFFIKALFDQKLIDFNEPFLKLFNQGIVYRKGAKMSKSKGNVVTPNYIFEKFGADTMRLYELFIGPSDQATEWSDKGVIGCYRFLNKVWNLQSKVNYELRITNYELEKLIHKTIKKVTEDIEDFRFNTAVSALMILANEFEKAKELSVISYRSLVKLLAPMAPHIAEELWQKLGSKKSIFFQPWPKYEPKLAKEEIIILVIQVNGKVRDKIEVKIDVSAKEAKELAISQKKVQKWIEGKEIKKIIFVPRKLINIVI
ncbi:MAG: leucine--tRNA ligase [Candidatus Nealsonbacteria bacterium CG_4_8_14_3_um_filter_37_36]|uniref:Leucine--tRNA ligase n=5 Tax=Candidatus Nealsoniibacteriota TaxID=1817911 RepID=A0A2H9N1C1_9BACT|nr:MAG: leucine--tRNA ligase [Candidatus Nealsonbacteria bacterium CG15_BIG_FIL_POST_REV_8_21_14_020_37_12]PIW91382.1 MAG: leucine--tRNA ligase [Candidatus Nealsonbacteria bacterium CG_4_8_14_3_um_filter_37_36]PJA83720.1 MAG: leucine--tRNA ligase [Candidatus Nealsonbacteria bacterium CG_4_9_14_3_um_filter_37_29]